MDHLYAPLQSSIGRLYNIFISGFFRKLFFTFFLLFISIETFAFDFSPDTIPNGSVFISDATADPATPQCTAVNHTVTATIVSVGPITSVLLNYSYNGVSQPVVTMTSSIPGTWTGVIPAAVPVYAIVNWTVTASDGVSTSVFNGTEYQDAYLQSLSLIATATPSVLCSGETVSLNSYLAGPQSPPSGYCIQNATSTDDDEILNVTFGSLNNSSVCGATAPGPGSIPYRYSNYTSGAGAPATPLVFQGATVPFSVKVGYCNGNTYGTQFVIYIDYNRNGSFTDSGEQVYVSAYFTGVVSGTTVSGTITIPVNALPGVTRLRVVDNESSSTASLGPCANYTWGETEDYLIEIAGTGTYTFEWFDGSSIGNSPSITYTPTVSGSHNITVVVTDANNCTLSQAVSVTVSDLPPSPVATNSSQCGTAVPSCSVVYNGGLLKWYTSPSGGTAIPGESGPQLTTYTISSTTTFYVSEFDGSCESNRVPVTATVTQSDGITLSASPDPVCLNLPVTLSAVQNGSTNNYSYSWSANPSAGSGINGTETGTHITVQPTAAGTYTYSVTGYDAGSNCTAVSAVTVTVLQNPVVSVSPSTSLVCPNTPVQLTTSFVVSTQSPYNYSWNPSTDLSDAGISNPVATTASDKTYIVSVTDANGCVGTASAQVNIIPTAPVPVATNSTQCGYGIPACSVSSSGGLFRWYLSSSGGIAIAGEDQDHLISYAIDTTTVFYVSEFDGACETPRTAVTATVTEPDGISVTASPQPVCTNATLNLDATQNGNTNNYTYIWSASPLTGSGMNGSMSGNSISINPFSAGTYTYTVIANDASANCAAISSVTLNVSSSPVITSAAGDPAAICNGESTTLTAVTGSTASAYATIGTGTITNSSTTYPSPYGQWYGSGHEQYLIRASELTAMGLTTGNLTSLAFNLASGYTFAALKGFTVQIAHTNQNALTTVLVSSGFTVVYSVPSYIPCNTAGWCPITFSNPFNWDGNSNIVIDVWFSNCSTCNGTASCSTSYTHNGSVFQTSTSFASTYNVHADDNCTINSFNPSVTPALYNQRPNMQIIGTHNTTGAGSYQWQWAPGLLPPGNIVTVNPSVTTEYTVTATDPASGCSTTATTTVTVNEIPPAPAGTNSVQCGVGVPTASVSGSGGLFNWYLVANGGSPLAGEDGTQLQSYSISTTTTFYVSEFDGLCTGPRTAVTASVVQPDAVTAQAGSSTVCGNASVFLSVSQSGTTNNYSYVWTASPVAGSGIPVSESGQSISVTPTAGGSYTYTVFATDAGTNCATTSSVIVSVIAPPQIDSIAARPSTVCLGHTSDLSVYSSYLIPGSNIPPTAVYDSSIAGSTADEEILRVNFGSINNPSTCLTTGGPGSTLNRYSDYTLTVPAPVITAGNSIPFLVQVGTCGGNFNNRVAIFIDYNRDGIFSVPSERAFQGPVVLGANTQTGNIVIPYTALSGITRMRVISMETSGTISPTAAYSWGETEDYHINISSYGTQNANYQYFWQPVPGVTPNITVAPTFTTTYTVTVTDPSTTCVSTASVTVNVIPVPPAPVISASSTTICNNGTSVLTITNPSPGALYQWERSSATTLNVWTPIPGATGNSYFTDTLQETTSYRVYVSCGTTADTSNEITITVNRPMVAAVTGAVRCGYGSVTLTATGIGTFDWYSSLTGGSPLAVNTDTFITVINSNTTFYVQAHIGSCNSDSGRTADSAIVTPPPAISISTTANPICSGESTTLEVTSSNDPNYSYQWSSSPPGTNSTSSSITVSPSETTTYLVVATDNSIGPNSGCGNTASETIIVNPLPPVPVVSHSNPVICSAGDSDILTVTNVPPPPSPNYTYTVSSIGFAPVLPVSETFLENNGVASTALSSGTLDDGVWSGISLPFPFSYFGVPQSSITVSTNGFITFGNTTTNGCCEGQDLPASATPNGVVALQWEDFIGAAGSSISYFSSGVAPSRKFVIRFNQYAHYNNVAPYLTGQIILNENQNTIELQVTNAATDGDGNEETMGLENAAGSVGAFVPGRNGTTSWTAANEGWLFIPVPPPSPASYTWSPATGLNTTTGSQVIATPSATTTYTVTALYGSTGCTSSSQVTVNYGPLSVSITPSGSTDICNGDSITLDAGPGYSSYSWSDGNSVISSSQSVTVFPSADQTYTVQVSNGTCNATASQQVTIRNFAPAEINTTNGTAFCSGNTTDLYINGIYTAINWSTGATTSSITVTASGTYVVTVNENGCSGADSIEVEVYPVAPAPVITAGGSVNLCWDGSTPSSSVTLYSDTTGAGQGAIVNWNTFFGDNNDSFTVTPDLIDFDPSFGSNPYTYNLTVTNIYGCISVSNNISVTTGLIPVINSFTPSAGCDGDTITITGSNFSAASSVQFNGDNSIFNVIDDNSMIAIVPSSATTGNIQITNAPLNCAGSSSAVFTVSCAPLCNISSAVSQTSPACYGDSNGQIIITLSNASTPVNYTINGSPVSGNGTQNTFTGLTAGNYVIQYTDGNGCSGSESVSLTEPSLLSASAAISAPIMCFGETGSVDISATGGIQPYAGTGTFQQYAGNNTYTVMDNNGCTASVSISLTEPLKVEGLTYVTNANCTSNSGTATVSPTGGTGNYSYLWSDNQTGQTAVNLAPGNYTVIITDDNGCTGSASATVGSSGSSPSSPGSINGPSSACRNQTGIVYSVSPVINASSYLWQLPSGCSGSSTTNSITVSFASNYQGGFICVTASNSCGASSPACINVPVVTVNPSQPTSISGPVYLCPGTQGTFSTSSGNAASYTWTVTGGLTIISGQGSNSVIVNAPSNFGQGSIQVYASNCKGNSTLRSRTVTGIPSHSSALSGPPSVCPNTSNVAYSIANVTGTTSYSWSTTGNLTIVSSNANSVTVNFGPSWTTGTLRVVTSNSCGSYSRTYTLTSTPAQPGGIAGPGTSLCGNSNVTYSVSPVANATSYSWTVPAGVNIISNTGNSITVNFTSGFTGSGNICVSAINTCGSSPQRCYAVTARPGIPAITGATSVCKSESAVPYQLTPVTGALSYTWFATNGASPNGSTGTQALVNFNGSTSASSLIKATANNNCGSGQPGSLNVTVNACREAESNDDEFMVYPNPSAGNISLQLYSENESTYNIRITNVAGQLMVTEEKQTIAGLNIWQLDLQKFEAGLYMIYIIEQQKVINTKILLIRR
jgi:hypothetical protein